MLCGIGLAASCSCRPCAGRHGRTIAGSPGLFCNPTGRLFWTSAALVFCAGLCVLVYFFTYLVYPPTCEARYCGPVMLSLQTLGFLAGDLGDIPQHRFLAAAANASALVETWSAGSGGFFGRWRWLDWFTSRRLPSQTPRARNLG